MFMENAMDGHHLHVVSAIEVLTGELLLPCSLPMSRILSHLCPKAYPLTYVIILNFRNILHLALHI